MLKYQLGAAIFGIALYDLGVAFVVAGLLFLGYIQYAAWVIARQPEKPDSKSPNLDPKGKARR